MKKFNLITQKSNDGKTLLLMTLKSIKTITRKLLITVDTAIPSNPIPPQKPGTPNMRRGFNNRFRKNAEIKKEQFSDWKGDKPNVKIVNTTNSGHYIHLGEPEWVITELETFLEGLK